ncbi:MAG TPA: BON domain-containing protein [Pyrinomonadaceae bacterium]|nr:BON domain-containing protein [Pyrinomonadaceae bacterium]
MKYIRNALVLSFAFLTVFAVGANAQTVGNSQRSIEDKVFKKIIGLPYYGVFDNIKFQVNGGTVTLYGKVYSLGVKKSAERAVKNIEGVSEVVNNIENLPPSSFDNQIRVQIVREFARNGGNLYRYLQEPNPSIRIIVENGQVSLEGYVANRGDFNLANILANSVPNVFGVTNNLVIEKEMIR